MTIQLYSVMPIGTSLPSFSLLLNALPLAIPWIVTFYVTLSGAVGSGGGVLVVIITALQVESYNVSKI